MDIFNTAVLNRVVEALIRPQTFFLTMFFPGVVNAEEEEIKFDVKNSKRRIAPFVSPMREGKVVESLGFETKTFKPAYVKDKRVFDPKKPLKRMAGETIGGSMKNIDRIQANLNVELADQTDMLTRRQELMAVESVLTGATTVSGEGFETVSVNYGRAAAHTFALVGAARWGEAGVSPVDDIGDWALIVLKNSGAGVTDVVLDADAWKLYKADPKFTEMLNSRKGDPDAKMVSTLAAKENVEYLGTDGARRFWVYSDWYFDEDTSSEVPFLPQYSVVLLSKALEGVRHYGAIRDEEAGFQAREFFAKSWVKKDPSIRFLLMQSAPLPVPYRINASMAGTVR